MYNVSSDYKTQINNTLRNPSYIRVSFAIIDPDAVDDATFSDNGGAGFSEIDQLTEKINVPFTYDTMEHNKFILDSAHKLAPISYSDYQGYASGSISDVNCEFTVNPVLTIDYTQKFEFAGVTITFDTTRGDFATELRVRCYDGITEVFNKLYTNTEVEFIGQDAIPLHDKMTVEFIKTSLPFKRIRVQYFGLGIYKTLSDSEITSTTQKRSVDLMSTVLPKGDFSFTFLDVNNEYDPDNPDGLFRYLEELQPVSFDYGYELDSGIIEWVTGGNNYSNGEVKVDSSGAIPRVTFNSKNGMITLTDNYLEGVYSPSGVSLYTLANTLLSTTGLDYEIDTALNSIIVNAPLPRDTIRNNLQLIANASRAVLDIDRNGKVTITQIDFGTLPVEDFKFDFNNMLETPVLKKYPPLKNVNTSYYEYEVETSISEVTKISIDASVNTEYFIEHGMATETVLSVDGTLSVIGSPEYFSYGCRVTLNGTGNAIINGKVINVKENSISQSYNVNGEDCNIKNELLSKEVDASAYATWIASILQIRNEYSFSNRGYPEIDIIDKLLMDTVYTNDLEAIVTESVIEYSGTLRGVTKVLV